MYNLQGDPRVQYMTWVLVQVIIVCYGSKWTIEYEGRLIIFEYKNYVFFKF